MIEEMWQMGKEIKKAKGGESFDVVENLVQDIPKGRNNNNKESYLVILKLDLTGDINLAIDIEKIGEDTPKKYLWVGNPPGAYSPQDRLTTNNLGYLVSQTIPNLVKRLPDGRLRDILKQVEDRVYFDLGEKDEIGTSERSYERYRYLWDLSKMGLDLRPEEIRRRVSNERDKSKKAVKLVADRVFECIKRQTGLNKNQVSLYTLNVNGENLVRYDDYRDYIYTTLVKEIFEDTKDAFCHLCGKKKKVTGNTTKFWFKFYITNKIGFSSNFGGNKTFYKNYSLCKNCYEAVLVAESFIRNKLRSWLVTDVYIIPRFWREVIPVINLERWVDYIKGSFNAVVNLESWRSFQNKLRDYRECENLKSGFYLNFLFGKKVQAEFKVYQLVQDVSPYRLDTLEKIASEIQILGDRLLGESVFWHLSLKRMFSLFPQGTTRNAEIKNKLEFYNSLFSNLGVSRNFLIKEFVEKSKEYYFSQKTFNEIEFCQIILSQNLLLRYLKDLDLLKGGINMKVKYNELMILDDIKEYLGEMRYDEPMISLFLLGKLIGEIGIAQYSKGDMKKPILNKLNFQGMHLEKIKRLFSEVFEKMRQYRVLTSENEQLYAIAMRLLDRNKNAWSLSSQDNVFYILSGYAYITYKAITKKTKASQEGGKNEG